MKIKIKEAEKKAQILVNHYRTGNYELVIANGKKLLKLAPDYFAIYNLIGLSYQGLGKWNEAIRYFEIALQINPNFLASYNNIGLSHYQLDNLDKAELFYKKNLKLNPKDPAALGNLGNLYKDINKTNEAIDYYKEAIKNNPKGIININNLGLLYLSLGKFEQAIILFKKCLEINSKFTKADRNISIGLKYDKNNPHIEKMEQKLNSSDLQEFLKVDLCFALGKAYDDIKDIPKAIEKYKLGNELKRKFIKYNIKEDIDLFDNIKNFFSKINLNSKSILGDNEKKIIFILGMPRSGTTLVEQIISSHYNVYGAGELKELTQIIKNNFSSDNKIKFVYNEQNQNEYMYEEMSNKYFDKIKRFNFKEKFITDKTPLNFRWIGIIKLMFPESKIIHCNRNPNDNCVSLYKNIFDGSLDWSYNIEEMSKYYKLYSDLMNFWNNKLPNDIYNLTYENLISDQKNEINKILKFCNLSYDENCFSFYKNKRQISTASVAQARNPIYKSSVKNWKKYEKWLSPLFENLK